MKIVGKRPGFGDETQKGASWDETLMSSVTTSYILSTEAKGGKEFDFPNMLKMVIAGNHRPNFISGESGGLTRRMLLLEVTNKPIPELVKVEENFAEEVVRAEGAAIMMWMVEGALLDFADKDHKIFDSLKQPMVDAAKSYTRE